MTEEKRVNIAAGTAADEEAQREEDAQRDAFFAELDASVGGVGNGGINMMAAFAVYSRLPVPKMQLSRENLRYALCCFPFVGLVIGIAEILWFLIAQGAGFSAVLRAGGMTLIPLLISGGIHMDGFLDTADAIASRGTKERRLQIMTDPHTGSFAIIGCCAYLLAQLAVYTEADLADAGVIACVFFLSRALGGYAALTIEAAQDPGFLQIFLKASDGETGKKILLLEAVLSAILMIVISPKRGIIGIIFVLAAFLICRRNIRQKFGGMTGDLQGFLILICELAAAYAVILLP